MITKVKEKLSVTGFTGSVHTFEDVKKQVEARLGPDVASAYDPYSNMRTFKDWMKVGYVVNKGEKSFSSIVMVVKKDKKGKVTSKFPKRIGLFHISQVKKID